MIGIKKELKKYAKEDVKKFKYFHKTDVNGYAYQDKFLCVTVPDIRKIAKRVLLNFI